MNNLISNGKLLLTGQRISGFILSRFYAKPASVVAGKFDSSVYISSFIVAYNNSNELHIYDVFAF